MVYIRFIIKYTFLLVCGRVSWRIMFDCILTRKIIGKSSGEDNSSGGMSKYLNMLKMIRFLRIVRLIRVLKLQQLLDRVFFAYISKSYKV